MNKSNYFPNERPDKLCESWKFKKPSGAAAQMLRWQIFGRQRCDSETRINYSNGMGHKRRMLEHLNSPYQGAKAHTPRTPQSPQAGTRGWKIYSTNEMHGKQPGQKLTPEVSQHANMGVGDSPLNYHIKMHRTSLSWGCLGSFIAIALLHCCCKQFVASGSVFELPLLLSRELSTPTLPPKSVDIDSPLSRWRSVSLEITGSIS
jgi:hypothetical protein